jgi:TatD DNase family protein
MIDKNLKIGVGVNYIDIHSHIDFKDFDHDRNEVLKRMKENSVATIVVGTDLESSKRAVQLANENEHIFACVGAHPHDDMNFVFDEKDFEEFIKNPKVVAVGECGLDYFRLPENIEVEKSRQKKEFIKQIEFAIKHGKPLMLHIRDAYEDIYEILRNYKEKVRGNIHFFAGSLEWAKKFIDLGFTLSFTGVITFARDYDEAIKNIPLDKLHAETDSPFVAPIPYRGKRNEPTYVTEVVKKIAEIRGEDFEKVRTQLLENARNIFNISI